MQIFMSYARPDQEFARRLATLLTESGFKVWIDFENVYPGENLFKAVGEALETSQAMVVVISPEAIKSSYLTAEIGFGISSVSYKDRLFPVMVEPTDEIPPVLKKLNLISAHGDASLACQEIVHRLSAPVEKFS